MMLITGASGFVGTHLMNVVSKIENLKIISRQPIIGLPSGIFELIYRAENIVNESELIPNSAFKGVSCIVHLAGVAHNKSTSFNEINMINRNYPVALAKLAFDKGVKKFIFISTTNVYDEKLTQVIESSPLKPNNKYSETKLAAESDLINFGNSSGMQIIILRPPLIYGAHAPGNFQLLQKLVSKVTLLPFSLVTNKRSFLSVFNLVDLIIYLKNLDQDMSGVYLVSDDEIVSTKEFTNYLANGIGKEVFQIPIPNFVLRSMFYVLGKRRLSSQLLDDFIIDNNYLKQKTGWCPKFTMEETMNSLKDKNDTFS